MTKKSKPRKIDVRFTDDMYDWIGHEADRVAVDKSTWIRMKLAELMRDMESKAYHPPSRENGYPNPIPDDRPA